MQPLDLADYTAPGHFPGFVSLVLVVLTSLAIAGLGIFARTLARRYRYRAFVAERSVSAPDEPLDVGFRVLSGDVEVDGPEPAIVVTVEQRGTEASNKGNWSTTWTEVRRTVDARPFYLALPSGERVRVEPDASAFLVDDLDVSERRTLELRTRAATLVAGERATVAGLLTRGFNPRANQTGYRHAEGGFLLVPPKGDRMIVSAEPLPDRHLRRAKAHQQASILFVILFAAVNAILFGSFLHRAAVARPAVATSLRAFETYQKTKNGRVTLYMVEYDATAGETTAHDTEEVTYGLYQAVRDGQVRSLPAFVVDKNTAWLGGSRIPLLPMWRFAVAFGALGVSLLVYRLMVAGSLAWYEQDKVVDTEKGRLADSLRSS